MTKTAPRHTGLLVIDKPSGLTSHDVVARIRRVFSQRQVGHSGTLDPDATGVLLVGLGRCTRLLRFFGELPKTYTADAVLGVGTSTLDASGEIVGRWDMSRVTPDQVRAAARGLTGEILQVPPMVSAVRIGGRRLHELARAGIEVERPARPVTVYRFEVGISLEADIVPIEVECSSGTFVRTLVEDLGVALGGGAHVRNLRRTRIGAFGEDRAVPLEDAGEGDIRSPADALSHLRIVEVEPDIAERVRHGQMLDRTTIGIDDGTVGRGPWAVRDGSGALLAVYEAVDGTRVKPAVVLA